MRGKYIFSVRNHYSQHLTTLRKIDMSYKWSNEIRLDVLRVESQDAKLIFKTDKEEAEVYLDGQDIGRVVHRHGGVETVITNENSHHIVVGKENEKRDVFHYLKPKGPAPELRLGITKHRGVGSWSSLPHDFELNLEPGFEEVFFHLNNSLCELTRHKYISAKTYVVTTGYLQQTNNILRPNNTRLGNVCSSGLPFLEDQIGIGAFQVLP